MDKTIVRHRHARSPFPYANFGLDAKRGDKRFEEIGPFELRPDEDHARLVARLRIAGGLGTEAAHAVALSMKGFSSEKHARLAVYHAGLLAFREVLAFSPSLIRGKIDDPNPGVAVTVPALRSLMLKGDLTPADRYVFWLLVGLAAAKEDPPCPYDLKERFRIARPLASLTKLAGATVTLEDDRLLPRKQWISDAAAISIVDGRPQLSPEVLMAIFPGGRPTRYAFVELGAVRSLSTRWGELAYRRLLAAAVESGAYWRDGGVVSWRLSPRDLATIFSCDGGMKELRKTRLKPMTHALTGNSRLRIEGLVLERAPATRGRATKWAKLNFSVLPSSNAARPRSGKALLRTRARRREAPDSYWLDGPGWIDPAADKAKRSAAAIRGHKTRRSRIAEEDRVLKDQAAQRAIQKEIDDFLDSLDDTSPKAAPPKPPLLTDSKAAVVRKPSDAERGLERTHHRKSKAAGKPPAAPSRAEVQRYIEELVGDDYQRYLGEWDGDAVQHSLELMPLEVREAIRTGKNSLRPAAFNASSPEDRESE